MKQILRSCTGGDPLLAAQQKTTVHFKRFTLKANHIFLGLEFIKCPNCACAVVSAWDCAAFALIFIPMVSSSQIWLQYAECHIKMEIFD